MKKRHLVALAALTICSQHLMAQSNTKETDKQNTENAGTPGFGGGFQGFDGFQGFGGFPGFDGGGMPDFGAFDMGAMMGEMPEGPTGHVDFVSSDLPLIQIFTDSLRIGKQSKITARMKITDKGQGKRNAPSDPANQYDGLIAIKIRGNSSAAFTQKRFTLELRNAEGKSQKASLLGMPADDDWVLLGPYNDRSMMRDAMAFDLWTEMGHWGSRTRYAEVLINDEYRGVYLLTEKIKRSPERVNINKAGVQENGLPSGGYILRVDATDADCATFRSTIDGVGSAGGFGGGFGGFGGFPGFEGGEAPGGFPGFGEGFAGFPGFGGGEAAANTQGDGENRLQRPVTWNIFYPKKDALKPEQQQYIEQYVAKAEQAIESGNNYDKYIDLTSFVDYFIHTELSLNADGFKRSAYFYLDNVEGKNQDGLLHAGPVWDYNLAYGNCNFCSANDINAFVYNGCETNPTPAMWKSLAANKSFMTLVRKRYAQLRKTILSNEHINAYIDQHAKLLSEAQERHFTKYPTLLEGGTVPQDDSQADNSKAESATAAPGFGGCGGFGGFGGFGGGGGDTAWFDAYTPKDYADEVGILKQWMADRLAFLDSQWK